MAESDAALAQVIGRQLQRHLVTRQNANLVFAHFAAGVRHEFVAVVQGYAKAGVGQHLVDLALHLDQFFLGQYGSLVV